MRSSYLVALAFVLSWALPSIAQGGDTTAPLGDVAKKNETAKKENGSGDAPKVKHVFTDDDMSLRKNPIPSITLQGTENTDDILAAIHEYRSSHSPEQTEDIVHAWFDEQAAVLSDAIDANVRTQKRNQLRMEAAQDRNSYPYNNYNFDGDYTKLNERQTAERWSQRVETRSTQENLQVMGRIQQVFMRVRADVICRPNKTKSAAYDWFRIRTANGVNTY